MKNESNMPRRGARRALGATVTVAIIAGVVALNILVSFLADRFMWQVDETVTRYTNYPGSLYTASEEFLDVVEEYAIPMVEKTNRERAAAGEEPITVNIIFCSERDKVYAADKLRMIQYTAMSLQKAFPDAVKVSYLNIQENPSAVQKYKATSSTNIYPTQVIFEFGTEYRLCSFDYFFLRNDENSTDHWAYNGEQKIASLFLALTRAEAPIAGFITNHGEDMESSKSLQALVKRAGYEVVMLDLSRDAIPADCRLLISYDPVTDYMGLGNDAYVEESGVPSEIQKLDGFLDKAYSFMLFADNETPTLPVLEEYMEEWGVTIGRAENAAGEVDNLTVRDQVQKLDKDGYIPFADYVTLGTGGSITSDMRNVSYPAKVVFPNAAAITMSPSYRYEYPETQEDATTSLLSGLTNDKDTTTDTFRYGTYYRNGVSRSFYDVFHAGVNATVEAFGEQYAVTTQQDKFRLMTVTTENRTVMETNYLSTQEPSYVAVFGSTEFASNAILDSAAYGNADVLLSSLRAMGREVMPADLNFKAFKVYEVDTDAYQVDVRQNVTVTVCMTLLPIVACAIVGVCVNVKRKYR